MRGPWQYARMRLRSEPGKQVWALYYLADGAAPDTPENRVYYRRGEQYGWCDTERAAAHYAAILNAARE